MTGRERRGRPCARNGRRADALPAVLLTAAVLAAGGCREGGQEADGPPGTAGEVALSITVTEGTVDPPPGRAEVRRGDRITLTVTSDSADELHVHGYDRLLELRPDEPATLSFTADRTGLFEVETHGAGLVLTQLEVR
ncbi:hypothetical protein GCM10009716_02010 [Streptomyces sodiiphilus]|uniref:EfeO-type cupredoxin-like domain-containing protein n=1 Tax=Streptomyces sodiiphilus TaxID=226217 RepID=A0ABN2NRR5_9ACTN